MFFILIPSQYVRLRQRTARAGVARISAFELRIRGVGLLGFPEALDFTGNRAALAGLAGI